jgi:phthalate 4,5-dioxygenase
MPTPEREELIAQVGPDSAMGSVLRHYWVPAIRSEMLTPGGAPVRLRLFGGDFVAFRSHDGRIGLFDEGCPHRGVSLALARNEDNALRCIFHGWKIDVSGKILELPTEPRERRAAFAETVKFGRYLTHEEGGIVWVWFAPPPAAPFPAFDFRGLPDGHTVHFVGRLDCHWLQALEMLLDPVHIGILHQAHLSEAQRYIVRPGGQKLRLPTAMDDPPPAIEIEQTDYGFRGAAIRAMEDGSRYVRVTEWAMPFFSFLATTPGETHHLYIAVPMDQEHTQFWYVGWNAHTPLDVPGLKANALGGHNPNNFTDGIGDRSNLWHQDRGSMRDGHFTGFATAMHEEVIVPMAQGIRQDFSRQNLGWSDQMIVAARDRLFRAASQRQQDEKFAPVANDLASVNPIAGFCGAAEAWRNLKP